MCACVCVGVGVYVCMCVSEGFTILCSRSMLLQNNMLSLPQKKIFSMHVLYTHIKQGNFVSIFNHTPTATNQQRSD
jgi:hypothetical protein